MTEKDPALEYHEFPTPGKISVVATKPCVTARDLSLAYSPGVAVPCLEIEKNPDDVYRYTSKGNLVAVISNGTAVLGLGDLGPAASKPVMEGKGCLFKTFADIDVFDLELDCTDVDRFVDTVAALAPTFGGINLEDIKSPECFEIETRLKAKLDIPVFHDDQHGTAIIAGAALINALEITGRKISEIQMVISGAGAAAVACANLYILLGMRREKILMIDSKGVIYKGRTEGMNAMKEAFAVDTKKRTLEDAMNGADVFIGLSTKDLVTPDMLKTMADRPIVFAMANPDPEIDYELAKKTRPDVIVATGRSDFPNQVNNVLGFPFIFRGALDVRAKSINEEMKMAAVMALANLAKEPVPDDVKAAYGGADFSFGPDYLIPKPFDSRVLYYVSPAVAKAAMESGVARKKIDLEDYTLKLKAKQNHGRAMLRYYYALARKTKGEKRIVFPEATSEKVMSAAMMAKKEKICTPVFIGNKEELLQTASRMDFDLTDVEIYDPSNFDKAQQFADLYLDKKGKKGVSASEAKSAVLDNNVFATLMLKQNIVDGLISGIDCNYADTVKPVLEFIGLKPGVHTAAALYMISIADKMLFLSDTAINLEMTKEKLADIALMSADFAKTLGVEPRVAMLSYSNFGNVKTAATKMVSEATDLVRKKNPKLIIDGEMQADTAVEENILKNHYSFSQLDAPANVLVFPDMQSANISFKLLHRLGGARVVGPIILGLNAPAYVLQKYSSVDEIFNMITVAVAQSSLNKN
jgi:malate dehydrogenase (oxaloacetate-decarboxylating)(NADP+)